MRQVTKGLDWPVFIISAGLLLAFVIASLINIEGVAEFVNVTFGFTASSFGAFWQVLMLATFFVGLFIAISKYGNVRLGAVKETELGTFKWISIIMATLLAGGGVFWAAAEPMFHFIEVPPLHPGIDPNTQEAVAPALAQSFMHWGFLAWAILGTVSAVVMMYAVYHRGMPMKPRSLLYPIFGEKIKTSVIGTLADAFSIIAVAAGTIGPIGFLGLQASYGMNALFGVPDTFATQLWIIIGLVVVITISAVTGLHRGIQWLSRFNVWLTMGLMALVLLVGPGAFIIDAYILSFGTYINDFFAMGTYRGDNEWLGMWTIFFWGWFIGYGPMMAMLITRISRGRTIRQIVLAVGVIAPVVTTFWFTIVGGSGIFYELQNPGSVSGALLEAGMPAAMIAITEQLPLAFIISPLFLLLTILFVVTTGDSMSYTISMGVTGESTPPKGLRVFWAALMGAIAAILLFIGDGDSGIDALQSFIVVTAVPVSILLIPSIWLAPRVAGIMAREQGITHKEK
ncbi:BCCT family transporter [Salsuginibacillus kocurii]|uniref:BCCT family transporter n=1 Tax=Salsuginibacillus kocurii TaxID=427078 RepID=UPI000685C776|nr:BCCT family transporter [Salsuginibacillus kocurii]